MTSSELSVHYPHHRSAVVQQNLFSSSISLARRPRQMGCIRPRVAYATATWRYELLWLLLCRFFFRYIR